MTMVRPKRANIILFVLHHLSSLSFPPQCTHWLSLRRFCGLCGLRGFDKTVIAQVILFLLRIFRHVFNFVVHLDQGRVNDNNMCSRMEILTSYASSRSGAGPAAAIFFAALPRSSALWNAIGCSLALYLIAVSNSFQL